MENMSNTDVAVSLHLYCPPFDACSVFNKTTGKSTKCSVRKFILKNIPEYYFKKIIPLGDVLEQIWQTRDYSRIKLKNIFK